MLEWKEYQKSDGQGLTKVDTTNIPQSAYLGVLGLTGLTAYLGLTEIGKPKKEKLWKFQVRRVPWYSGADW
jgi:NADPH-dependent curcumin reductase CurA